MTLSNLEVGIVGLPNVGKSTLFNAITKAGAEAANYPFCTIEPNVGVVDVPDARLGVLHEMYQSKKTTPASVRFVDIAGLVRGASKGEGLGNQFLEHIRQVERAVQAAVRMARKFVVVTVPSKPDSNPEHIHLLTKDILTRLFTAAGCGRLHFDGVEGHLFLVAPVA